MGFATKLTSAPGENNNVPICVNPLNAPPGTTNQVDTIRPPRSVAAINTTPGAGETTEIGVPVENLSPEVASEAHAFQAVAAGDQKVR